MNTFEYQGNTYSYILFHELTEKDLPVCEDTKHDTELKYRNLSCAFDIETSKINEHFSTMYVWAFGINNVTVIGRTWEEFKKLLKLLQEYYNLGENNKLRVWVHNLSFEWQFMKRQLKWNYSDKYKKYSIFAKNERKVVYAITEDFIEFRDSLILTQRPLRTFKEAYKLDIGKLSGEEFDYSILRSYKTVLTNDKLAYQINDVQVLTEWDRKYIRREFINKGIKIPLTSTGIVRDEMKRNFKSIDRTTREWLKNRIVKSFPSKSLYKDMITWVYRGGFVHANIDYVGTVLNPRDMHSFDKKSSYPSSALQNKFPWRFVRKDISWFHDNVYPNFNYKTLVNDYAFMAFITFDNIESRTSHHIESKNKLVSYTNAEFDNGRLIRASSITVCLTELDYLNYNDFYSWTGLECHNIYIADKEPLPDFVKDMFLKYFYLKETLEKDTLDYNLSKYKLNGLYGQMVSGLLMDSWQLDVNSGKLVISENKDSYEKIIKKQILLPQWGVWVSAYSRRSELIFHAKVNNDAVYGDTDSCKIINTTSHLEWIHQYNESLRRINRNMYVGDYDRSIFSELGTFQDEDRIYKFSTLGAKRYLHTEVRKDKKTKKYKLETSSTVAGCPKGVIEEYATSQGKTPYEVFKNGMSIDDSKKLCSFYDDNENWETFTDCDGNTVTHTELSSVTLNDIPFTMTLEPDFDKLVKYVLNYKMNNGIGR